jgi:hypothetical protein
MTISLGVNTALDQGHGLGRDDFNSKDIHTWAVKVSELMEWVYKAGHLGDNDTFSQVVGFQVKCLDWYVALFDQCSAIEARPN